MAGKVRHLKERKGRYSARLVVPKDLRAIIGKAELETQLGPDRRTALARLPAAVAALQTQIAEAERKRAASTGTAIKPARHPLTEAEIAFADYQRRLAFDSELRVYDPVQSRWYAQMAPDPDDARRFRDGFSGKLSDDELDELVGDRIRLFYNAGNTEVAKGTVEWRRLAQALCVSGYEAMAREFEREEGDFTGQPSHPLLADAAPAEPEKPRVSLTKLVDDYYRELERSGKGREAQRRWKPVFEDLRKFLRHDDVNRITAKDMIAWKDHLLVTLSPSTVHKVHLSAVRTVMSWANANLRIDHNPAAHVVVKVSKQSQEREKGYRDDEALAIIKAAQAYVPSDREDPKTAAAKTWAPLLCALSGARIVEITQLRKEDIRRDGEIDIMRITPEAGSVKTGNFRDVPLHPQIIALGFLDFVEGSAPGPLFHSSPNAALAGARTVAGRISQWLQAKELVPDGMQPSHAWRHRFKTTTRDLGVNARVADAIQGHAARSSSDDYGDVTLKAKKALIDQIPAFDLG